MKTKFLLSATSENQFPRSAVPEFAFLGRSNVGKSSLINALLGEPVARTSSTPGRTRAINFFALHDPDLTVEPRMLIADLPGYGYAKVSKSISAQWPQFINPYLERRPNLVLAVCLVDSSVPPQASDRQLLDALRSLCRNYLVVGTKADRLSGNGRTNAQRQLRAALEIENLLLCSARTGYGVKEVLAYMMTLLDHHSQG